MSRISRNSVLNIIVRTVKPSKQPRITPVHQERRMNWAKNYMMMNFEFLIITDECRAILDSPDGWSRGCLRERVRYPIVYGVSMEEEGVIFWSSMVQNTLIGQSKNPRVKIISEANINFFAKHFQPWYKSQPVYCKRNALLIFDGGSTYSAKATQAYLKKAGFKDERLMTWPANSLDLNPIGNLWSIIKRRIHDA